MLASLSASGVSSVLLLTIILAIPSYATWKKISVFDSFLAGAGNAIEVVIKLIPYLVAMIVAVGMLRDSGAVDSISNFISPVLNVLAIPKELAALGLMRPFSGAASNAMMFDLIGEHGPNSLISLTSATIMGSTETTFYMVAIYFGAIGVTRTRHAIAASLVGELAGFLASIYICRYFFAT